MRAWRRFHHDWRPNSELCERWYPWWRNTGHSLGRSPWLWTWHKDVEKKFNTNKLKNWLKKSVRILLFPYDMDPYFTHATYELASTMVRIAKLFDLVCEGTCSFPVVLGGVIKREIVQGSKNLHLERLIAAWISPGVLATTPPFSLFFAWGHFPTLYHLWEVVLIYMYYHLTLWPIRSLLGVKVGGCFFLPKPVFMGV
jgi:hypothetical protein